jgi:hypothetical protein
MYGAHDNVLRRNSIEVAGRNYGIIVGGAPRNVVEGNRVFGTPLEGGPGIWVTRGSDGTRVEDNVVENFSVGIDADAADMTIEGNVANYNAENGIEARDPAITLTRNRASYNGNLGINAVSGVIDGGGNKARGNGNPQQCVNVECK